MTCTRFTACLLLIFCASAPWGFAQQPPVESIGTSEDQVTQLERDWLTADAKGDADSLRRIIANNFIGTSFDGQLLTRDDIIPEGTGPGGFAGATPGDTHVRIFGDTAVLIGVINTASAPQPGHIRVTLVCQRAPKGWQIIAAQLTH